MKPASANVTSTEAIERFRSRLIVYRDKIKPLLGDATDEVSRTGEWLQQRRQFWESELRRRKHQLDDARQALFSARFSNLREARAAEEMAVHRAERALAEAEEKLAKTKRWIIAFDQQVGPSLKQIEQLQSVAITNLAKAEAYLSGVLQKLELYASTSPAPTLPSPPAESAPKPEATGKE